MIRGRVVRLALIGAAATVAFALVAAFVTGVVYVRRPLPTRGGDVTMSGLRAKVVVKRDARAVPQIYADTPEDLFRAQGFVQAEDRFFEMDLRRHITAGRLSELVGANADALAADTSVRTMGWRDVAQRELAGLDPATRGYLQAFSDGVNDYIRGKSPASLSLSYTLLGAANPLAPIELWQPVDSLSWLKAMAWDLRSNYSDELERARVFATVRDVGRVEQLWPAYPFDRHLPIIPDKSSASASRAPAGVQAPAGARAPAAAPPRAPTRGYAAVLESDAAQKALDAAQRAVDAVPVTLGHGDVVGSNSWVLSGSLTTTGKPLLANDPHLDVSVPGVWYQMGLHCTHVGPSCPFDVTGFTFAGLPGVVIGHNARMAWGMTNLAPDVSDFYLEQVSADGTYLRDGRRERLAIRQETIKVAGGAPVTITVRSTGHGPLLSDAIGDLATLGRVAPAGPTSPLRAEGYGISLAWTALQPGRTMQAVFAMDAASDFASFRTAALLLDSPAQNLVYADVDGHIGYQAPGRIPIRAVPATATSVPADGTWPQPGWDSAFDWRGYLPTDGLPYVEDPADGFVVAANQAVGPPAVASELTQDWDYGYRSQRIRDLITAADDVHRKLGVADMQAMQRDTYNGIAASLVPLLRHASVDPFTAQAQHLLDGWDFTQPATSDDGQGRNSAAAAYFNAVWASLLDLTFGDEMPEGTRPNGGDRWFEVVRDLLNNPQDAWWDNRKTADIVETRDEIIRQAMVAARLRLTSSLGKDPQRWQWGRLHRVELTQTPLGAAGSPAPVRWIFNLGPFDAPGGTAIVDALAWDAASGTFAVTAGPSMRMVVNLADLDGSTWVNETGSSGHPFDSHYDDQVSAWLKGQAYSWPFTPAAVTAATKEQQVLLPVG